MPIVELSKDYLLEVNNKNIKVKLPDKLIKQLKLDSKKKKKGLSRLFGSLKTLKINPVEYQKKVREEWER